MVSRDAASGKQGWLSRTQQIDMRHHRVCTYGQPLFTSGWLIVVWGEGLTAFAVLTFYGGVINSVITDLQFLRTQTWDFEPPQFTPFAALFGPTKKLSFRAFPDV